MIGSSLLNSQKATAMHAEEPSPREQNQLLRFARDLVVIVASALLISFLIKTFLVGSFYIPSSSMNQTLQVNDRILVNKIEPTLRGIQRGDVIVFRDPGGWLTPTGSQNSTALDWVLQQIGLLPAPGDQFVIKRVIGVGGDRVKCCDLNGHITINGVPITEPYVYLPPGETAASGDDFDVTVPEGALWVMGDNRYGSKDSRYNTDKPGGGFVAEEFVVGVASLISWPISRWSTIDSYHQVFAKVPPGGSN